MAEFENAADELAALMRGEIQLDESFEDDIDTGVENEEDIDNEDTDLTNESAEDDTNDDAETNEMTDDDSQDTEEDGDDEAGYEEEGNTQVEDSNLDDNEDSGDADTAADEDDSEDDSTDETSEGAAESTDTESKNDGEEADTDTIDYKKQYEELLENNKTLQGFYDEVTSDFKANGTTVKGFKDPKKFIQANQMAAGLSDKMRAFKPYRPFMSAIKEQGWLEDPSKFDMAVNLMKKDPEAIKQLIKDSGMDVMDADFDNINYEGKSYVASAPEIVLDDMLANARNSGVETDMRQVLEGRWLEDGSLNELVSNPEDAQAFVNHMVKDADGRSAYDDVQERIAEKLITDYSGTFATKSSLQQYRDAAGELERETIEATKSAKLTSIKEAQEAQAKRVADEKAKIESERKEREYKAKVQQETKKVDEARKKATSVSKPKRKAKAKPKFDPIDASQELGGEDLMKYFNESILGRSY